MSESLIPPAKNWSITRIAKAVPTLFVLSTMAGGWLIVHRINEGDQTPHESVVESGDVDRHDILTLPRGKIEAARFEVVPAQSRPVQHVHTVPGRIRYDDAKHVDVKAPMDGILTEMNVTPGEKVEEGQLLAVLRSAEVGQARAEILRRQQHLDISNQMAQRERTLAENLSKLSSMLDEGKSIELIEENCNGLTLGSHRQDILSAYSKMRLSAELLDRIEPLANSGSVADRVIRERQSERQVSESAFRTARDLATFASNQSKLKAEADLAESERQLNLAWQALDTLLGYKEARQKIDFSNEDALSRLEVRAPMAGSVESRGSAGNERVVRGSSLVVLANTDSLSVAASIRESDWSAVSLQPGTRLSVTIPALPNRVFEATIRYVGREVQSDTNAIPLVAMIDNGEGFLRPGMFVRVTLPIGPIRQALSVKPESVIQHDNQQFVFVDLTGGSFKRVDVSTGQASEEWIEVTKGLEMGELVVTNGAFLLKSELLLKGESE